MADTNAYLWTPPDEPIGGLDKPIGPDPDRLLSYVDNEYDDTDLRKQREQTHGDAGEGSKYRILEDETYVTEDGRTLYRIEAKEDMVLADGTVIKAGDKGGYVESYANLSQEGNCWVADDAKVYDQARVSDGAVVSGEAEVSGVATVRDRASVSGHAKVKDQAVVQGEGRVMDYAMLSDKAVVEDQAAIGGRATMEDSAEISGEALVGGEVHMLNEATVTDKAIVAGRVVMKDQSTIRGNADVTGRTILKDQAELGSNVRFGSRDDLMYMSGTQKIAPETTVTVDEMPTFISFGQDSFSKNVEGEANPKVKDEIAEYTLYPERFLMDKDERFDDITGRMSGDPDLTYTSSWGEINGAMNDRRFDSDPLYAMYRARSDPSYGRDEDRNTGVAPSISDWEMPDPDVRIGITLNNPDFGTEMPTLDPLEEGGISTGFDPVDYGIDPGDGIRGGFVQGLEDPKVPPQGPDWVPPWYAGINPPTGQSPDVAGTDSYSQYGTGRDSELLGTNPYGPGGSPRHRDGIPGSQYGSGAEPDRQDGEDMVTL